jgi:hypothetical protein
MVTPKDYNLHAGGIHWMHRTGVEKRLAQNVPWYLQPSLVSLLCPPKCMKALGRRVEVEYAFPSDSTQLQCHLEGSSSDGTETEARSMLLRAGS